MNRYRPLTRAEIRAIVRELDGRRDRAIFATLLHTGARTSEVLGLDLVDVRRADGQLRREITFWRRITKNQTHSRAIRMHRELAGALRLHLEARGTGPGPLFESRERNRAKPGERNRLSRKQAWDRLRTAFDDAGLPRHSRATVHSIRATFAQRLHDRGTQIEVIADLMGHRKISDTRAYFLVRDSEKDAAIDSLPSEGLGDRDDDDDGEQAA